MGWRFRKIFRLGGGFRTTLSRGGVGMSWGIPGLRFGVSPTGRKYVSIGIPMTGIYFIKYFTTDKTNNLPPNTQQPFIQSPPSQQQQTPTSNVPWWKQRFFTPKK